MPPPRRGSSKTGYERKRSPTSLSAVPESSVASSTSSVFSRQTYHVNQGYSFAQAPARSPSPPASSYFPLLSNTDAEPQPLRDAEAHFAYSTTLRRHQPENALTSPAEIAFMVNAEASSLWQKAVSVVTGRPLSQEPNLENGHAFTEGLKEERPDTISARFAHYTVEVRVGSLRIVFFSSSNYSKKAFGVCVYEVYN